MDRFTQQLGQFIRLHRLKRGLTQVELGRRLGIRADRLSRIERGRAQMLISEWLSFCQALGLRRDGSPLKRAGKSTLDR